MKNSIWWDIIAESWDSGLFFFINEFIEVDMKLLLMYHKWHGVTLGSSWKLTNVLFCCFSQFCSPGSNY